MLDGSAGEAWVGQHGSRDHDVAGDARSVPAWSFFAGGAALQRRDDHLAGATVHALEDQPRMTEQAAGAAGAATTDTRDPQEAGVASTASAAAATEDTVAATAGIGAALRGVVSGVGASRPASSAQSADARTSVVAGPAAVTTSTGAPELDRSRQTS